MQQASGPNEEVSTYLVMPDGTVCWSPMDSDIETWQDECRDLQPDPEDFD